MKLLRALCLAALALVAAGTAHAIAERPKLRVAGGAKSQYNASSTSTGSRLLVRLKHSGLGDVAFQFYGWGNLAVWLGATLVVDKRPPQLWAVGVDTARQHHLRPGDRVSSNETWGDFLEMKTVEGETSFVTTGWPARGSLERSRCVSLRSPNIKSMSRDLAKAHRLARASKCFTWTVEPYYWETARSSKKQTFPELFLANGRVVEAAPRIGAYWSLGRYTSYVTVTTSAAARRAAARVVGDRRPYTSLHVRMFESCSRSVNAVIEYAGSRCAAKDSVEKAPGLRGF